MDLHLAPNSTQFFSMCRAKTLAQNRSVFGNAEVNVDVRYSLIADLWPSKCQFPLYVRFCRLTTND